MNSLDFQASWEDIGQEIPIDAIALDKAQLAQATQWSSVGMGAAQQWQIYRNGLALLGLEQWLRERGLPDRLNVTHSSLRSHLIANLLDAVAQVTVGSIQLALVIRDFDHSHPFPVLLGQHEPLLAHLYLWVDLWEETGHVAIASGLWQQDLKPALTPVHAHQWQTELSSSVPWLSADQILLALRFPPPLETLEVLSINPTPVSADLTVARLKAKLQRWTELSVSSEVLMLEDAVQILRSPELSQCFTQTLQQTFHSSLSLGINVGQWWSKTVDAIQAEMGWHPLPMLAMRSSSPENTAILGRLFQQGIEIPAHAQASYQDLSFADQALRLYVVAWVSGSPRETSWSLLIALCNVPGADLTQPIQFEIRDGDACLAQQQLHPQEANACRYIQVTGGLEEQFRVTLTDLTQPERGMTLPPFFFNPVESS